MVESGGEDMKARGYGRTGLVSEPYPKAVGPARGHPRPHTTPQPQCPVFPQKMTVAITQSQAWTNAPYVQGDENGDEAAPQESEDTSADQHQHVVHCPLPAAAAPNMVSLYYSCTCHHPCAPYLSISVYHSCMYSLPNKFAESLRGLTGVR